MNSERDTEVNILVRGAVSADMPSLGRLGTVLLTLHHDLDPERFISATPRTHEAYGAYLEGELLRPEITVLTAVEGDEVLGYAYAGVEDSDYMALRGPAGVIYDLVVDASRRGEGIGRMLLDACISKLEGRGVPRVVLSTAARNKKAQVFFAKAGFRSTMVEMTREPILPEHE